MSGRSPVAGVAGVAGVARAARARPAGAAGRRPDPAGHHRGPGLVFHARRDSRGRGGRGGGRLRWRLNSWPARRAGQRAWLWGTMALSAGAFAGAVVLAPPASAVPVRGLAWLLFLGSSVHVAATGWLYTLPDVRAHATARPLRYVWIPAGLIVTGAITAAAVSPAATAWLLLAYFAWQFFHFQKQNLGLAALAASVHRVRPLSQARTPGPDGGGRGRASWAARRSRPSPASGWARERGSGSAWRGCRPPPRRDPGWWRWSAALAADGPAGVLRHVPDGAAVLAAHLCLPVALCGGGRHDHRPRVPVPAPGGTGGGGEPPGGSPPGSGWPCSPTSPWRGERCSAARRICTGSRRRSAWSSAPTSGW